MDASTSIFTKNSIWRVFPDGHIWLHMVAKISPQSSHTVRDDNRDILKLIDHEKAIVKEDKSRATSHSSFTDLDTKKSLPPPAGFRTY